MDVSIIYVNYNCGDLIVESIRMVKEKTINLLYEIIIVDNNSIDGSFERIKATYPDVIYISAGANLGFGRANNLGIDFAKGKMMFFLNPDTLLVNNAIKILYDYLEVNKKVGVCGGNLLNKDMQPNLSFGSSFPSFTTEILSIFYLTPTNSASYNMTGKPMCVSSIVGADLMVKRSVLEGVGSFSPEFFMNYEETELCYRVKKAGFQIVSVPDACIIHFEGQSDYISISRSQLFYDGKYIYFNKLYGKKGSILLYRILLFKCKLRILQFKILNNKTKIQYWKNILAVNKNAYFKLYKHE